MSLQLITDVAVEQIEIEQARKHCRITPLGSPPTHPDDALLTDVYIPAAREYAEDYTGLAFAPKVYDQVLDSFPTDEIKLEIGPVTSIESVKYVDEDEVEQTMDPTGWVLDDVSKPQWLLPVSGTDWPTPADVVNAVRIRLNVGYSLASDSPQIQPLPKKARIAMLLIITHLYENRKETVEKALEHLPLGTKSFLEWIRIRRGWA